MEKPTLSPTEAVLQAGTTVGQYMGQAVKQIDYEFGEGFAKKNPLLVAECIRSQTMDFNHTALVAVLYEIRDEIRDAINIASAVLTEKD